ncbi:hypothetical protein ABFX02_08G103500 [Erythranthe guttata]
MTTISLLNVFPTTNNNFSKPNHNKKQLLFNSNFLSSSSSSSRASSSCNCRSTKNENTSEGFSVLKTNTQGDIGSVWSSMGFYMFSIHIPLSFGGLSAAANILHQPVLDPQTEALLILGIQILELIIVLLLLKYPQEPRYNLSDFFNANKERSGLLASVLGFGFLLSLVFAASYFADSLMGPKDVNNPFLKEIISSGSSSTAACVLVYCFVTPFLEEVVYRGFLLTSLCSKMKWQKAVIISSIAFSAAHFSADNFIQLFIVGFVLGCSYCWTGTLTTSLAIHSLYNALVLFSTFVS